jgi:hypothetical protein
MQTVAFDHPVPELTEAEDSQTLAAIKDGIAQLDGGQGVPIEELSRELAKRC